MALASSNPVHLVAVAKVGVRGTLPSASAAAATLTAQLACTTDNEFDGRMGLRVSAIFVILFGSIFGKFSVRASYHHYPREPIYVTA